jgi:hypothetical protein
MSVIITKENTWDETNYLESLLNGPNFTTLIFKKLSNLSSSAYEIGLVKVENDKIVDYYYSNFKPIRPVYKKLQSLIPIDIKNKIDDAPSFDTIFPKIKHFFDSRVVITPTMHPEPSNLNYICDYYKIDIAPLIFTFTGTEKSVDVESVVIGHKQNQLKNSLDLATEAAISRINNKDYYTKIINKSGVELKIILDSEIKSKKP